MLEDMTVPSPQATALLPHLTYRELEEVGRALRARVIYLGQTQELYLSTDPEWIDLEDEKTVCRTVLVSVVEGMYALEASSEPVE
jgi:hypothetical protein